MKYFFPYQNKYLQTNRSDRLGSIWSSFNLDFQTKLATMRLSNKLVTNLTSSDDADLGLPTAFEFWYGEWWAMCGTRLFKNGSNNLTTAFAEEIDAGYTIGDATSRFDITNPIGTTFRYTYDNTGTNPGVTALTFPIGATVVVSALTNFNAGNQGTFTVTGSGANYFEVTNASGFVEANIVIGSGYISVLGGTFGKDYSSTVSDMVVFNDKLWATSGLNLRYRDFGISSSPWINVLSLTTAGAIHKLVYSKLRDRLYFVDQSTRIGSVDTSNIVSVTGDFTINPGKSIGYISTMVSNSSYIWVGGFRDITTGSPSSGELEGTISQWDGFSNQVTNEFLIKSGGILAMTVLGDIPYAIDSSGRILKYNGYSFDEIARFPVNENLLLNSTSFGVQRFMHQNGITSTKNNTLLISIQGLNENNTSTTNENFPSGIWELDLSNNNLTHRYSPTLKSMGSSTITDYGQNLISAAGAIKINTLQSDSTSGRSSIIAGFNYYTDATTIKSGIFIDSPKDPNTDNEGQKRGYFVTTWFESYEITDNFTRLWATFKKFLNSTDKMIFKYRVDDIEPIEATITWTSTTSFTTTTDISDYVGYEVEILQGTGSGSCTHISTITEDAGTYTATLDTIVTGVTGTAKARFQKWIKLLPEITGQTLSYGQCPIIVNDTRIQIKGVLEWTGDNEFHKMAIVSTDNIKINS